jgi:hypothetical protein
MTTATLLTTGRIPAALAALRVVGVRARERARGALDAAALRAAHGRQVDFLAALCAAGPDAVFELRTIVQPEPGNPGRGNIFPFLLVRAEAADGAAASVAACELIDDAMAAFQGLGDVYDVAPVCSVEELRFAANPFEIGSVAEVSRLEAAVEPGALSWSRARNLGFTDRDPGTSCREQLHHVYSWVPRERSLRELYQILLAQPGALLLSVQVARRPVSAEERDLRKAVLARAERWLNAHDQARTSEEARASRAVISALVAEKIMQDARLDAASYAVRVRVGAPSALRSTALEAYARHISAPLGAASTESDKVPLRGGVRWRMLEQHELGRAAREFGELAPALPQSTLGQAAQPGLAESFDILEAQCAFRLPVPDTEEFPGLTTRFARLTSLPRGVPAMGARLGMSTDPVQREDVRIQTDDRRRHCYVVGQSGTGKSTLFCAMALEDIRNGSGVCVIDPHGDLIDEILLRYPKERADDLVLFDAGDRERPLGLNPLEHSSEDEKSFLVQQIVAMMFRLFPPEMLGPMFERTLRNCLFTVMAGEEPGTLLEVPRLFMDKEFHKRYLPHIREPQVRAFWQQEFAPMSDHYRSEFLGYFVSKLERFVADPLLRNIIGQPRSAIRFDQVMDEGKVLLVNLSKGAIGDINSALLGMTIVCKLQAAAMARTRQAIEERRDFYMYVDEFQSFASATFATLLSEARKFRLNLVLTNQYTGQLRDRRLPDDVLGAVLGNVGTLIAMRVGIEDAPLLAKHFAPVFEESDLSTLPNWHAYVSLLVDGQRQRPFSMRTVPDAQAPHPKLAKAIRDLSRLKFGRARSLVEEEILERWA